MTPRDHCEPQKVRLLSDKCAFGTNWLSMETVVVDDDDDMLAIISEISKICNHVPHY